jgi:hypothetical protein
MITVPMTALPNPPPTSPAAGGRLVKREGVRSRTPFLSTRKTIDNKGISVRSERPMQTKLKKMLREERNFTFCASDASPRKFREFIGLIVGEFLL